MKHVILGVGAAGIAAAKTIRQQQPDAEILMISADDRVHSRCMLHHFISGGRTAESLDFAPENFFAEYKVEWLAGKPVTAVDTAAKTVTVDGQAIPYDTLLIATGATSVIPPVGVLRTAQNVYGLRDLCDAEAISKAAETAENVVVIGSGLVGLDAAYALLERGKKVTVVEMADRILPLQLDAAAAKRYQTLFEQHGATFKLDCRAEDTVTDAAGNVTALQLACGDVIPADFLVVAAGVRPGIAPLEGSGIAVERGVTVDDHMRTSAPDVYAAGDVTGLAGIWPNATKMGEVAGMNMCGIGLTYRDTFCTKNTINFFGLLTLSVGAVQPGEGDEVVAREDRNNYKKAILRDGKVKGVLLQGDIANAGFWQYLIKNGVDISGIEKPVFALGYADFFATGLRGAYEYSV